MTDQTLTLKPGDEVKIAGRVLVVDSDGVAKEIDRAELDALLAEQSIEVDMRRIGICHATGVIGSAAAAQMIRDFASKVSSFSAEPPKPKTPKLPVIKTPREPLKARRKQLLKILRRRDRQ